MLSVLSVLNQSRIFVVSFPVPMANSKKSISVLSEKPDQLYLSSVESGSRTVILTARKEPGPIKEFLKYMGVKIPIEIVTLDSSSPNKKRDWIEDIINNEEWSNRFDEIKGKDFKTSKDLKKEIQRFADKIIKENEEILSQDIFSSEEAQFLFEKVEMDKVEFEKVGF